MYIAPAGRALTQNIRNSDSISGQLNRAFSVSPQRVPHFANRLGPGPHTSQRLGAVRGLGSRNCRPSATGNTSPKLRTSLRRHWPANLIEKRSRSQCPFMSSTRTILSGAGSRMRCTAVNGSARRGPRRRRIQSWIGQASKGRCLCLCWCLFAPPKKVGHDRKLVISRAFVPGMEV